LVNSTKVADQVEGNPEHRRPGDLWAQAAVLDL
jgi:hypothetical protein